MQRLLERKIASVGERLVLLTPPKAAGHSAFNNVDVDARRHDDLLRDMQRLRGSVYLHDGAVAPAQLSPDGLHQTPEDEHAWHLLMLDKRQRVSACIAYVERDNTTPVDHLRVQGCHLAQHDDWRPTLRKAVESELAHARREGLHYAEIGGWAVESRSRRSTDGLLLALAAFSFARVLGDCIGLTTATVRHSSASILKRLGGRHLEADGRTVPAYFDPKYGCEMELLRFDSRQSSPRFRGLIEMLREKLAQTLVIGRTDAAPAAALHAPAPGVFDRLPSPFTQPEPSFA